MPESPSQFRTKQLQYPVRQSLAMAFNSKVVILLLVSSLAWWQASGQQGTYFTIIVGLDDLAAITNVVTTYVNELSSFNVEYGGNLIDEGFKVLNNGFVQANNTLKTVPGPLEGLAGIRVVNVLSEHFVVALKELLKASSTDSTYYSLRFKGGQEKFKTDLKSLKGVVVDAFGVNLQELVPKDLKEAVKNYFQALGVEFDSAISKY